MQVLVVVLIGVLGPLSGRVVYLRRCASFHDSEARRFAEFIGTYRNITPLEVDAALEVAVANPDDFRLDHKFQVVIHHKAAADLYRNAVYRPWTMVHEQSLPDQQYEE